MVKILSLALVGILMQPFAAFATGLTTLEPVVVTATKLETPLREVASSVTVITSARKSKTNRRIRSRKYCAVFPAWTLSDREVLGQQTSIFLRGGNSTHTLVLVDGIEINDPSNPGRSFDFASLATDNIERIEIVRGPGSTLYGSDALGGVINIITRKGSGKPRVTLSAEGGSFDTHHGKTFRQRGQRSS